MLAVVVEAKSRPNLAAADTNLITATLDHLMIMKFVKMMFITISTRNQSSEERRRICAFERRSGEA